MTTGTNSITITSHSAGDTLNSGDDIAGDIGYTFAFPDAAGLYLNALLTDQRTGAANQARGFINDDGSTFGGSWVASVAFPSSTNTGDDLLLEVAVYDQAWDMLAYEQLGLVAGEGGIEAPDDGIDAEPPAEAPPATVPSEPYVWPPEQANVTLYEQENPTYQIILPITPAELPETADADVKNYRIIGVGTHSFPDGRTERKYTLSGYFPGGPRWDARLPHIHNWRPPQDLAEQIRQWMDRKTRLRYRSTGRAGHYDIPVYLSKYSFTRTGHAGDIKYEVDLTEWRTIRVQIDDGSDASQQTPGTSGSDSDQTDDDQQDEPTPVDYTVQSGDTLWFLAKQFLGDSSRWPELYEANKDTIGDDPHWIYPGQVFHIPGGTVGTEEMAGFASADSSATEGADVHTDAGGVVVNGSG